MSEKRQLKHIVKNLLRRGNGLPDHQLMHPFREWFMCLAITTVILLLLVFFSVRLYQYYTDLTPELNQSETATTTLIYKSGEVYTAIENFKAREARYQTIRQKLEGATTPAPAMPDLATPTESSTSPSSTEPSPATTTDLPPPVAEISPEASTLPPKTPAEDLNEDPTTETNPTAPTLSN